MFCMAISYKEQALRLCMLPVSFLEMNFSLESSFFFVFFFKKQYSGFGTVMALV